MKDANGREIKVGDRVRYARNSGVTMWPAPPVATDTVRRFASSTCVELVRGMKGSVFTFLACGLEVVDDEPQTEA